MFNEFRLALLDEKNSALPRAEPDNLRVHQRIGDVQDIDRHAGLAKGIGEADRLQRPHHGVVDAALHDNSDVVGITVENLVQLVVFDEFDGCGPTLFDLLPLMQIAGGRQHDAIGVAPRRVARILHREGRPHIILCREAAVDVAGTDTQLQHHRRVRCFGEAEAHFDGLDDRGQVRARIEQPDLRFHREGMAPLLHDRGAFAVILAQNDQAPPVTPLEDKLAKASDATLVPTGPLNVTAPRSG